MKIILNQERKAKKDTTVFREELRKRLEDAIYKELTKDRTEKK